MRKTFKTKQQKNNDDPSQYPRVFAINILDKLYPEMTDEAWYEAEDKLTEILSDFVICHKYHYTGDMDLPIRVKTIDQLAEEIVGQMR